MYAYLLDSITFVMRSAHKKWVFVTETLIILGLNQHTIFSGLCDWQKRDAGCVSAFRDPEEGMGKFEKIQI